MRRVADIIMDILVENGITDCFAVVGGGAMHLNNALALNENINKYFNHHEQACSMAADAYARISGKMPLVCVTSGPGGTNAITGVLGAWQDSLPMLVISGQVRYATTAESIGLKNLRYRGIQEFDIINSVKNMTKYSVMIKDPLAIKSELQKAINIAMSGRRGPVWIDIPLDVQSAKVNEDELYPVEDNHVVLPCATKDELNKMWNLIKDAKRPCLLPGNGVVNSGNTEQFRAFAKKTGIPVIASCIAADVMFYDDPLFFGMSGSIGPRPGNFILQNADVIVSLGSPLGFKVTGFAPEYFAPNAKIIMIDIEEEEMKKLSFDVELFVHSDLSMFFQEVLPTTEKISVSKEWLDYCKKLKDRFSPFEPAKSVTDDERVTSYKFWELYAEYEPEDSISVLGANTANSAKLQIGVKKEKQRIVASNNVGSMGADLPETIGAAIASGRTVICLTGDGSIMMNLQELQTIAHYDLPAKIVVFNNEGYGAIRQTSNNFFNGVYVGCTEDSGLSFPPFEKVAEAFSFPYKKCENNGQIKDSLKWLFEQKGRAFLEVLQKFDDPVSPKVMSRMNEDGSFSTPALHDMWPFLDKEDLDSLMF